MNKFLLVMSFAVIAIILNAQSPTLNLVGNGLSVTKGSIDTELLTELIQQKQDEVKQRLFRNTIVKSFNKADYNDHLKNFTTYNYIYNLMNVITSAKNKTSITKDVIKRSTDFALVYSLALFNKMDKNIRIPNFTRNSKKDRKIKNLMYNVNYLTVEEALQNDETKSDNDSAYALNLLVDVCYDIILNDSSLKNVFKLEEDLGNPSFLKWYSDNNVYHLESKDLNKVETLKEFRIAVEKNLRMLMVFNELKQIAEKNKKLAHVNQLISNFQNVTLGDSAFSKENILEAISSIRDTLGKFIAANSAPPATGKLIEAIKTVHENLGKLVTIIDANYDNYRQLILFIMDLKKSKFREFSLTKDQYHALRYIITEFMKRARNEFENDVIASILDFLIENTIINYAESNTDELVAEADLSKSNSSYRGYLYIDIESMISAIHNEPTFKKGVAIYISPLFDIGINYGYFPNTNNLNLNSTDLLSTSLPNMYFAAEKIGVKYKIWNWKYTRSAHPGKSMTYYRHNYNWANPQKSFILNDFHLIVYGSGLLYNIANLKSNESFNHPIVGSSLGFTFFNGISASAGVACPFTERRLESKNMFLNFALDIPIIEYIGALRKKK